MTDGPRHQTLPIKLASSAIFSECGGQFLLSTMRPLTFKEISFTQAEGRTPGEFKHGPTALVGARVPVGVFPSQAHLHEKAFVGVAKVAAYSFFNWLGADATPTLAARLDHF